MDRLGIFGSAAFAFLLPSPNACVSPSHWGHYLFLGNKKVEPLPPAYALLGIYPNNHRTLHERLLLDLNHLQPCCHSRYRGISCITTLFNLWTALLSDRSYRILLQLRKPQSGTVEPAADKIGPSKLTAVYRIANYQLIVVKTVVPEAIWLRLGRAYVSYQQ